MSDRMLVALVMVLSWNEAAMAQTSCAPPSLADRVALNPVAGSPLMTVPVEIDGKPKQFLLDVGADPDEISQAAVTELQLPSVDRRTPYNTIQVQSYAPSFQIQAPVFDTTSPGTAGIYRPRVQVASFTMGGATLHNLQFLIANDQDMGKSKPYDGRLTAGGFRQYDLDFDFGGKKLSFLAATACTDPNQIVYWPHQAIAVVPMTLRNNKIGVPVTIGGHVIDAVIDTGSDRTVMRRGIAERILGLKADTDMTPTDLRDGAGERVYRHNFPQIAFEGVVASNVPALIQANSLVRKARRTVVTGSRLQVNDTPDEIIPDLALGMDVLGQLHLYVSYGQNKIYVTPAG